MATAADRERKNRKADAVVRRIREMDQSLPLLIGMMDEAKLDLMILALGLGETILHEPA